MKTNIEDIIPTTLNLSGRRGFLKKLGMATAGGAALASTTGTAKANHVATATDLAVLNFALNLEYLEAEYYLYGTTGQGLEGAVVDVDGSGGEKAGRVIIKNNPKVKFDTNLYEDIANEIALDEQHHVIYLRLLLAQYGGAIAARPVIDLKNSFKFLGKLIGVDSFDPFENEVNFLIGAFIFEDVGVTAYKGASPLLTNKSILEDAAGVLAVEGYHAGILRTILYQQGREVQKIVGEISKVRQSLDDSKGEPKPDKDEVIRRGGGANLVPTDTFSVAFSRTTRQVLNIVYGGVNANKGLFFPNGFNGAIS